MNGLKRLPAVVQGLAMVVAVSAIGILPLTVLDDIGFRFTPRVPWVLPVALLWIWAVWRFLTRPGWWREHLCVRTLSGREWILAGGVLCAGTVAIHVLRMALLRWLRVPDVPMPAIAGVSASVLLSSFVVTSFAAGLFEEAAYRGYLRSLLQSRYGGQVAIISAALVFALAHLSRGKGFLVVLPLVFLFGYLYGLVAWKTGSIWPGIVVHTSYNLYRLVEKFFTLTVK